MQVTLTPVTVGALVLCISTLMLLPLVIAEALGDRRRRAATGAAPAPRSLILDDSGTTYPMARRVRHPSQRTARLQAAPVQPIDRISGAALRYDSEWTAAAEVARGRVLDLAAGVAVLVLLAMVWR